MTLPAFVADGESIGLEWAGTIPPQGQISATFVVTYGINAEAGSATFDRHVHPASFSWV